MGQKRVRDPGVTTFRIFLEQPDFFVGSDAHRFEEESEPVILNYFLSHSIVGKSVYMRQKGAKRSRWKRFLKISPLYFWEGFQTKIRLAISRKISGFENSEKFSHDQQIKIFNLVQLSGMETNTNSCRLDGK